MSKFGRAAGVMLALGPMLACSHVIGLGTDYYAVSPQGGAAGDLAGAGPFAGASVGGSAAAAAGGGGSGGLGSRTVCLDHPLTPHAEWVASASNHFANDLPSNLIDGSGARWSTGKPQSGDEWLQIDFGTAVGIRTVELQQDNDPNDYPRAYAVSISDTAQDLNAPALFRGEGTSGPATRALLSSPHVGRYLLVKQLSTSLSWWSVDELVVTCTDD